MIGRMNLQLLMITRVEDNTDGSQNDSACGGLEPCELVIDSNSFIEESDNAMSVEAEAAPKLLTETNYLDLPSISSSSSTNNCRSDYWSPASKIISGEHLIHVRNIDANLATLGDGLQLGQGLPCSEDRLNELQINNVDFICLEYENNRKEQSSGVAAEEIMPYSNDPNLYLLSSGRWTVNPGQCLVHLCYLGFCSIYWRAK